MFLSFFGVPIILQKKVISAVIPSMHCLNICNDSQYVNELIAIWSELKSNHKLHEWNEKMDKIFRKKNSH